MMTKRTEITIETARVTVISTPKQRPGWCAECDQEVDWISLDEAALISKSSSRDVFQMIEAGGIHANETAQKLLMVCAVSLMSAMQDTSRKI